MIDPDTQHQRFLLAVDMLGGIRATARAIGVSERTMRYLIDREKSLHIGFLDDIAKALQSRADQCRDLERQISPLFNGNLTEAQRTKPLHGHARARRAAF